MVWRKPRPVTALGIAALRKKGTLVRKSGRDHSVDSETEGAEKAGIEGVRFVNGEHLPPRIISSPLVVEFVGLPDRPGIEHVGTGNCVLFRRFVVDFNREVILGRDLLTRKSKNPSVPCPQERAVWQRIKSGHKTEDSWINLDLPSGEVTSERSR